MLMRIALVYVLAVMTGVFAFALYWQESRLSDIRESYLRTSNELTVKTQEADKLRGLKTVAEERAFFAESRLRDMDSERQSILNQMANARKVQAEAEAKVRDATAEKMAILERVKVLESKVNQTAAAKSAEETSESTPILKQKLKIEPDPNVKLQAATTAPQTTGAIVPATAPAADVSKATSADAAAPKSVPIETKSTSVGTVVDPNSDSKSSDAKAADAKRAKAATAAKRKPRVVDKSESFFSF